MCELPRIERYDAVLDPGECRDLIVTATPVLRPSRVYDASGELVRDPIRACWGAELRPVSPWLRELDERLARLVGRPVSHGEPLHIVRYRPGEGIGPHYDGANPFDASDEGPVGRRLTMLLHLRLGDGGGLWLPRLGTTIPDELGSVLVLHNRRPDDTPDPMALHGTGPLVGGERWVGVKWWWNEVVVV